MKTTTARLTRLALSLLAALGPALLGLMLTTNALQISPRMAVISVVMGTLWGWAMGAFYPSWRERRWDEINHRSSEDVG